MIFHVKPAGINSHGVSEKKNRGFIEFLKQTHPRLIPLHRLDKETSGIMAFAENKEEAGHLGKMFENHQVEKTYLFITKSSSDPLEKLIHQSFIRKSAGNWTSSEDQEFNSLTEFEFLEGRGNYHLYAARPKSGKTHQIRLHAKDIGIPILGDSLYGGAPFHRLCLHCKEMKFKGINDPKISFGSKEYNGTPETIDRLIPEFFHDLKLLDNPILCKLIDSIKNRFYIYPQYFEENQSIRLSHKDGDPLRVDKLGNVLWMGWWNDSVPNKEQMEEIIAYLEKNFSKQIILQHRTNREKSSDNPFLYSKEISDTWNIKEEDMTFELRKNQGFSPGLFLDQRANRRFVKNHSSNKKILNLFSYTGGFSLAAALGGAKETWSVDTSKTYLNWSKTNFELNGINPDNHKFYQFDTQDFLRWAKKKDLKFDLIICDPPSFGRSGKKVFKLNKDWKLLAENMTQLLAPRAELLFSCNLESWSKEDFDKDWKIFAHTNRLEIKDLPHPDLDFERIDQEPNLKSVLLKKNH